MNFDPQDYGTKFFGPGRPFTREEVETIVWGSVAWDFLAWDDGRESPEDTIARCLRNRDRYPDGAAALAAEVGIRWPLRPELAEMGRWAGKAKWALHRRDEAVRAAVAAGCPKNQAAKATGLSRPGIDRILARG